MPGLVFLFLLFLFFFFVALLEFLVHGATRVDQSFFRCKAISWTGSFP